MKYWAEVYHIDGFSIDLVDCFDTKAYHSRLDKWLDEVKENVAKTDPRLVIWGDNYTKVQLRLQDQQVDILLDLC